MSATPQPPPAAPLRRPGMDAAGVAALVGFSVLFGLNQVVIKIGNGGFQPVFMAGLRSLGALAILLGWMALRGRRVHVAPGTLWSGLLVGVLFTGEFTLLFWSLDHTTVARASIVFYSMPVWLTLGAHLLIPQERLTGLKLAGLVLAMAGVAWVLARPGEGAGAWAGDLAALLAAMMWAGIGLTVRVTPVSHQSADMQLFWQLSVSAVMLLLMAPLFGPLLRDVAPIHLAGLAFQIVAIASFGFLVWFYLMKIYPAGSVASFSFLSPVFAVILGWLLLDETIGPEVAGGLALVALGLVLINRAPPAPPRCRRMSGAPLRRAAAGG